MSGASRDNKRETLACILMKHEIHSYQSKAVNATVYFLFFFKCLYCYYYKWCCHYYYDYYYYCCCRPPCKECFFLYIVIKKSCWTVTYSFESGLNFIHVGTVNGEMGLCILETWLFFFLYLESISNENKLKTWKWLLFVIVLTFVQFFESWCYIASQGLD